MCRSKSSFAQRCAEPDGLALSSRNQYLNADQRREAVALNQALNEAEAKMQAGEQSAAVIEGTMRDRIAATPGAVLDYAAAVDADSLKPITPLRGAIFGAGGEVWRDAVD